MELTCIMAGSKRCPPLAQFSLPFILNVVTKEEVPDKALIKIDQEYLDEALAEVKAKIKRFDAVKKGEIEPTACGKCEVCRAAKKVEGVLSYKTLFRKEEEE